MSAVQHLLDELASLNTLFTEGEELTPTAQKTVAVIAEGWKHKLLKCSGVTITVASQLRDAVAAAHALSNPQREALKSAIIGKLGNAATGTHTQSRVQRAPQNFEWPEVYFTEELWAVILDNNVPLGTKVIKIVEFCRSFGLITPNENTYRFLVSALVLGSNLSANPQMLFTLVQDFKRTFHSFDRT